MVYFVNLYRGGTPGMPHTSRKLADAVRYGRIALIKVTVK